MLRQVAENGITPLELGLSLMRELWEQATHPSRGKVTDLGKAMQAHAIGKDLAPYLHPKLAAMELTGENGAPMENALTVEFLGGDPGAEDPFRNLSDEQLMSLYNRVAAHDVDEGGQG
ncbi:hypothetical protein [Nitrospirillum viridazoti]|nr:hypothetical protein [Nitrospirillum amazonense]